MNKVKLILFISAVPIIFIIFIIFLFIDEKKISNQEEMKVEEFEHEEAQRQAAAEEKKIDLERINREIKIEFEITKKNIEEMYLQVAFEDKEDFSEKFSKYPPQNFKSKLIYIDTRDTKRFKKEREHDYLAVKNMADNIGEKGVVFMLADLNNVEESKKILNEIFPNHNYSYTDSPFIMGYTDIDPKTGKREELIIDLTGMSKNCLLNYLQDVEQAIVRDTINDLETRKQWRLNSLACEIPELTPEQYSSSIEKLFRFFKILF